MSYLRNAIYTSLRTAPRTLGRLFRSKRPQEGDAAAEKLTSRIMDVLEDYDVRQKKISSGWMPDAVPIDRKGAGKQREHE